MSISSIGSNVFMRPRQDPDAYAEQYAAKKGITLEEAKQELKAQFGDPKEGANVPYIGQSTESSSIGSVGNQNSNGYVGLGFNENDNVNSNRGMPGMDPDAYAEVYAYQNNMTVEEAKEELKSKYGDPQQKRLNLIA